MTMMKRIENRKQSSWDQYKMVCWSPRLVKHICWLIFKRVSTLFGWLVWQITWITGRPTRPGWEAILNHIKIQQTILIWFKTIFFESLVILFSKPMLLLLFLTRNTRKHSYAGNYIFGKQFSPLQIPAVPFKICSFF